LVSKEYGVQLKHGDGLAPLLRFSQRVAQMVDCVHKLRIALQGFQEMLLRISELAATLEN
jgi:hypothetical protein